MRHFLVIFKQYDVPKVRLQIQLDQYGAWTIKYNFLSK